MYESCPFSGHRYTTDDRFSGKQISDVHGSLWFQCENIAFLIACNY